MIQQCATITSTQSPLSETCGKLFPAPRADTQLLHITEIGTVHKTALQKEEKNYWNEGLGRSITS